MRTASASDGQAFAVGPLLTDDGQGPRWPRRSSLIRPERQQLLERLRVPGLLLLATHVVGTIGYRVLWDAHGATLLDAFYMTFITITTIGYAELHPLGDAGRVLTMVLAGSGIGSLFYSFTVALDYASSDEVRAGRRRRKMQRQIDAMEGHFILAGVGRVGREAASELAESGVPFVVVDPRPAVGALCEELRCPWVPGDATLDASLIAAGVKRARGLLVTTSSDATNLYVILSARLLNAELFIASRAVDESSVKKLLRAGASRAISPYAIGGRRLAHVMLSPRVVDFLETALTTGNKALNIDDVIVAHGGQSLESLQVRTRSGATVLAVVRDGQPIANPGGAFELMAGDRLLALGTAEQLKRLEQLLSPEVSRA